MEKRNKLCIYSIIALILSVVAFVLYAMVLNGVGLYVTWITASITALCFPLLAKYMRNKSGTKGKALEIIALIVGAFDFYFVIFAATIWNINIAFVMIAVVCVLYAKLFNKDTADAEDQMPTEGNEETTRTEITAVEAPKPAKARKQRYCKYCGGAIDPETKKCAGCGKQFFHIRIRRKHIISAVMAFVIIGLVWGNVYQAIQYQNDRASYESRISELDAAMTEMEAELKQKDRQIEIHLNNAKKYRDDISELRLAKIEMKEEIEFYDRHVVFVNNDGTKKYHKYDCDDFDTSYFWAYNTEAAEGYGYKPCSKCCK